VKSPGVMKIAQAVFQVLTESATIADAKCRRCQIRDDPVSLAEVQEPEGLNQAVCKTVVRLTGGPRVRIHLPPARSHVRTWSKGAETLMMRRAAHRNDANRLVCKASTGVMSSRFLRMPG
jgi:hypothetical protein